MPTNDPTDPLPRLAADWQPPDDPSDPAPPGQTGEVMDSPVRCIFCRTETTFGQAVMDGWESSFYLNSTGTDESYEPACPACCWTHLDCAENGARCPDPLSDIWAATASRRRSRWRPSERALNW